MNVITAEIYVDRPPEVAFKVYVEEIDAWWPRQGKFRYTFAGPDRESDKILMEAGVAGRFWEVFDDGSEYDIGSVMTYEPPHRIVYSWADPDWSAATTVEVTFTAQGEGTLVKVVQSGFEDAGAAQLAEGYAEGGADVLTYFKAYLEKG